jgi:hypothetical protein
MHTTSEYDACRAPDHEWRKCRSSNHWRSHQALKRGGAKDLKKIDAENLVYVAESKRTGIGLWGYLVLAAAGIACALYVTAHGREFPGQFASFLFRLLR